MHGQATKLQGRLAIIRERRAHCQTVASDRLGFLILARGHASFNLAHAFCILLELSLGMPIGFGDRLGSFFEIVELTQLVRDVRQDLLYGQADGALRIRNDRVDRHGKGVLDLTQQVSEVVLSRTVEAPSQQHFTRERVAQHPQHIMIFVRLETVDGHNDVPLLRERLLETALVSEAQREQFFVTLKKVGDGARSDGNLPVLQRAMDFGDAAMLTIAQRADESDDVKAKLAVGQGPGTFLFRANRQTVARAQRIVAAANAQGEAANILKRGDGARGVVGSPECAAAT